MVMVLCHHQIILPAYYHQITILPNLHTKLHYPLYLVKSFKLMVMIVLIPQLYVPLLLCLIGFIQSRVSQSTIAAVSWLERKRLQVTFITVAMKSHF